MSVYRAIWERSLRDPEGFWGEAAETLHWDRRWDRVLDASRPPFYRWFAGGLLNTCYNAVDRHVAAGRGGQAALIHDSPVTGTVRTLTYAELQQNVARFAGALVRLGARKGDRVVVYMPMVPEAIVAMLACARIGAIHSVVFGGFASHELAKRIEDAKPVLVVSASCGIEPGRGVPYKPLLDAAIEQCAQAPPLHRPAAATVARRTRTRPRPRLGGSDGRRARRRLRAGGRHRSALHSLHLGHDRPTERYRARPGRPCRSAAVEHAQHLRRPTG